MATRLEVGDRRYTDAEGNEAVTYAGGGSNIRDGKYTSTPVLSEEAILAKMGVGSLSELPLEMQQNVRRIVQSMPHANQAQQTRLFKEVENLGSVLGITGAQNTALGEGIGRLDQFSQQIGQAYDPYAQAGQSALGQQQALLGLGGPEAQAQAYQNYQQSPASQFQQAQGEKAILRNSAAIGGLGGGNVRKALLEHGQGVASQGINQHMQNLGAMASGGFGAMQSGMDRRSTNLLNQINARNLQGQNTAQGILGAQQQGAVQISGDAAREAAKVSDTDKALGFVSAVAPAAASLVTGGA
jgi:hypothetical protein